MGVFVQMVEEDVYVGSEGDVEGVGDDELVTDELLEVDEAGAEDYVDVDAGTVEVPEENGGHDAEEPKQAQDDGGSGEKGSRKRSRSHSKSPPEKDDFDDAELDSVVDETGGFVTVC